MKKKDNRNSKYNDHKLIDILAIAKSKSGGSLHPKVVATITPPNKSDTNPEVEGFQFPSELEDKEGGTDELIQQLDQLNQELDMGEKLLNNKADPSTLNVTKITDSLAVLLGGQAVENSNPNAGSIIYANAQRQDYGSRNSSDQQSNVTGNIKFFKQQKLFNFCWIYLVY